MDADEGVGQAAKRRSVDVEKSPNDKLNYRLLLFENGFEALLISSDDTKKNKAAASVAVGAGSFSDPQGRCEGLAHYLEHMLFMGSEKYPGEDEMEDFLTKNGGHSNAYTEAGHTCYYFEVNKSELHKAVDMLAQFFVAPLLKTDAAEREINAIDSEFRLTQNSDGSRVEQLFASFAREGHPYRTFGWGNLKSLAEATKKAGVDLNDELRIFYNMHYRAPRIRLCVYGVEPLDGLEELVRTSFAGIPLAAAGEPASGPQEAALAAAGAPFDVEKLPKLLRVRPVKDTHKLTMSWQLPPTQHLYKSRPAHYVSHLIGHEGAGSLLSWLKTHGLATSLTAGVNEDSFDSNSTCCIFSIDITLTVAGLEAWPDAAHAALLYLDMLRREGPQEWVHQELVLVQDMGWRFLEETNPTDQVQNLACQMLPVYQVDHEHVLRAPWMTKKWDPEAISALLAEMRPERLMLDILSSAFGRAEGGAAGEEDDDGNGEGEGTEGEDQEDEEGHDTEGEEEEQEEEDDEVEGGGAGGHAAKPTAKDPAFDLETADAPSVEPHFGTEFWEAPASEVKALLARWAAEPASGSSITNAKEVLRLPDRNVFLATDFDLKAPPAALNVEAPQLPAAGLQKLYPSFPPLPEPLPMQPQPLASVAKAGWRAWHLQDTVFKTPRSEIWLKLATDGAPLDTTNAAKQVMLAMLSRVLKDTLNETAYLAEQASLHISVSSTNYGLDLTVGGFHHKLPLLLEVGLKEVLAFGEASTWAQRSKDSSFLARFEAQKEQLLRAYRNAYLRPGDHAADLRRLMLMSHKQDPRDRAQALESVDIKGLAAFALELIPKLRAEVLLSGNATAADAEKLVMALPPSLREAASGQVLDLSSLPKHPPLPTAVVPKGPPTLWVEDSPDSGNKNVALEMHWQLEATTEHRPKVVMDLFEAVMSVPLFDVLRTKQQIGYVASCGMRHTQGVLGFSVWLLSSKMGPAEIGRRVEAFLVDFRQRLLEMSSEDFERHVSSLAAQKLEPDRTLVGVQESAFGELQERKRVFDRPVREALELATVQREDLLRILDEYIAPGAAGRRLLIVASVGGQAKATRAAELEAFQKDYPGSKVVTSQAEFLASTSFHENLV